MIYSQAFFDLQVQFACRVANLSGLTLEQALLDYTNLYIRFGLGRVFDRDHPGWRQYLDGLQHSADPRAWTYRFYLACPHDVEPPSLVASFGCFSYAKPDGERLRLHFENRDSSGHAPLSRERQWARLAELRALFAHVEQTEPAGLRVAGTSWLYNLPAYRRLFPDSYLASARAVSARFRNMPLWGQFVDRHGGVRRDAAETFLERLSRQAGLDGIDRCFPLQPLALEAPVADFCRFYSVAHD
jgi:hypothetical protein